MPGHAQRPVAVGTIGPCSRPVKLSTGESRGMRSHDDVVLGGARVWHLRQGERTDAGGAVSNGNGLHGSPDHPELHRRVS
jgi:hypothetical protein